MSITNEQLQEFVKKQPDKFEELDQLLASEGQKKGALINVLHGAQEIFGHLPKEVQLYIARKLNKSLAEVYGVATFYSYFSLKPQGKYKISVCMGTACYVKGAGKLIEAIQDELGIEVGETSADGLFTLEASRCIGACGLAPVMTIGEDVYGRLDPKKVPEILAKYRETS